MIGSRLTLRYKRHALWLTLPFLVLGFYSLVPYGFAGLLKHRVSGLPVSYVLISVAAATGALNCILKRTILPKQVFFLLLLFLIWGFIFLIQLFALLITSEIYVFSHLKEAALLLANFLVMALIVWAFGNQSSVSLAWFQNVLCGGVLVIGFVSIIRFYWFDVNPVFFSLFPPMQYRLFSVMLLIYVLPILYLQAVEARSASGVIGVLFLLYLTLLVGSRTGYLAALAVIAYLVAIQLNTNRGLAVASIIFLVSIGVVALAMIHPEISNSLNKLSHLSQFLALDVDRANELDESARRITMLVGSFEVFADNPYFGVGLGKENLEANISHEYLALQNFTKPHNAYLYFLASTGFIGAFLLFLPAVFLWRKCSKLCQFRLDQGRIAKAQFMGFGILLMGYNLETGPVFWILLGVTVAMVSAPMSNVGKPGIR